MSYVFLHDQIWYPASTIIRLDQLYRKINQQTEPINLDGQRYRSAVLTNFTGQLYRLTVSTNRSDRSTDRPGNPRGRGGAHLRRSNTSDNDINDDNAQTKDGGGREDREGYRGQRRRRWGGGRGWKRGGALPASIVWRWWKHCEAFQ